MSLRAFSPALEHALGVIEPTYGAVLRRFPASFLEDFVASTKVFVINDYRGEITASDIVFFVDASTDGNQVVLFTEAEDVGSVATRINPVAASARSLGTGITDLKHWDGNGTRTVGANGVGFSVSSGGKKERLVELIGTCAQTEKIAIWYAARGAVDNSVFDYVKERFGMAIYLSEDSSEPKPENCDWSSTKANWEQFFRALQALRQTMRG
jgi:hypothetical protein